MRGCSPCDSPRPRGPEGPPPRLGQAAQRSPSLDALRLAHRRRVARRPWRRRRGAPPVASKLRHPHGSRRRAAGRSFQEREGWPLPPAVAPRPTPAGGRREGGRHSPGPDQGRRSDPRGRPRGRGRGGPCRRDAPVSHRGRRRRRRPSLHRGRTGRRQGVPRVRHSSVRLLGVLARPARLDARPELPRLRRVHRLRRGRHGPIHLPDRRQSSHPGRPCPDVGAPFVEGPLRGGLPRKAAIVAGDGAARRRQPARGQGRRPSLLSMLLPGGGGPRLCPFG